MTATTIAAPLGVTVLICSTCGTGSYAPTPNCPTVWTCDECGHDIVPALDIDLDPGEVLARHFIAKGELRLAITTRPGTCGTCGSANHLHFSVRVGDDMPANLIPCPESE
jgi:hypothetical protein